ncbi:MAG: UDP-N-acetylmuramate--L-alanine ligase [Desulfobulbus propionicus]|nr:MAG: UDP-N-acetylmuramate--L-alanine ligase [Desulfobulbus propionicus]
MYKKNKHIHFVGIGGIGMSGIAELLLNLGYQVSGSDLNSSGTTRRLESLGAAIYQGHDSAWIAGADVVVTSSAIGDDNPEVRAAAGEHVPIIQRAEMLAELMRLKRYGIAVAGSHGKTSTTSMVAAILAEAGLDPTVVVGGKVDSLGGNAKLGEGEFLVAEADESDGSFLKLSPVIEVVTNIDVEHLDFYRDLDHIKDVFLAFIEKLPFYGVVILCLDNENVAQVLPKIQRRVMTYGLSEQAALSAHNLEMKGCKSSFTVRFKGKDLGEVELNRPGRHLVYNSLAAVGVALELEIPFPVIARALALFNGVQRRLEVKGEQRSILVVDDYGHHPTEIRATLDALRKGWPDRRLLVVFQPHRYSRTRALIEDFATAFHRADRLFLTDIYPAGEQPLEGVNSEALLDLIQRHGQRHATLVNNLEELAPTIAEEARPGDLVLTLGAGNIYHVGTELLGLLGAGSQ